MIVLHYLNDSRAFRILWLLEELNVPYKIRYWRREKSGNAPAALANIHPSGKSPVIEDDGLVVAESGLIIQYLVDKYGKGTELAVDNDKDKLAVDYWLFAGESMMVGFMITFINSMALRKVPFGFKTVIGKYTKKVDTAYPIWLMKTYLKMLDQAIRDNRGYVVAGHLTGAEIMCALTVNSIRQGPCKNLDDEFPHVAAWSKSLARRPAFKRAAQIDKKLEAQIPNAKL